MFRGILLFAMITAVLPGLSAARAENRMALVIGQSAYRSAARLANPVNDAKAVSQALSEAGFEVTSGYDLSQVDMRKTISKFAADVAAKGPDTVALVFYAGHGLQIDGDNYLLPVDIQPKSEADIQLSGVRLDDLLNALTSTPNKIRIVLLDACRNDPFPDLSKTVAHGLAIMDARVGGPGTFLSFSTSPGALADDGNGPHSPYTTALLPALKQRGIPIEETFKQVRVAVNKATDGRQTPWDTSSLTEDFEFNPEPGHPVATRVQPTLSLAEWKQKLRDKDAETANELMVAGGTDASYEAFLALHARSVFAPHAREWLDRHHRMVAWNKALAANTAAAYRAFLAQFPDSDLTPTARKLEERAQFRESAAAGSTPASTIPAKAQSSSTSAKPSAAPSAAVTHAAVPTKKRAERNAPKRTVHRARHAPRRRIYYGGYGSSGGGYSDSGY